MLTEEVVKTIDEYGMLSGGEQVTAALSGGADSVCLLLILKELEDKFRLKINAIHINHGIRGKEAERDEEFCHDLCHKLGVELIVKKINVPEIAEREKKSLEEAARDVRYAEFAAHTKGGKLATAHTASDNAETVIHNLARGTGLKGLCGIPPVRGNIIRPLIGITREDVENYLDSLGQNYVTDSTNLSDEYTRNRIRHNIIPEILRINNGFFKTFCAELKIFSDENFFIEKFAENAYNICNDNGAMRGLEKYDPVVRKRCIAAFLKKNGLRVSFDKINAVDDILEKGGKISLEKNIYAVCRKSVLTVLRQPERNEVQPVKLCEGENSIFAGKTVLAEINHDSGGIIDMGKVKGDIMLRSRRYGDRIQLAGRDFTSSVKKLINERIRPDIRPYLHFLEDDEGVIYVEGIGIADRVKPDENTAESLNITIRGVKPDA